MRLGAKLQSGQFIFGGGVFCPRTLTPTRSLNEMRERENGDGISVFDIAA